VLECKHSAALALVYSLTQTCSSNYRRAQGLRSGQRLQLGYLCALGHIGGDTLSADRRSLKPTQYRFVERQELPHQEIELLRPASHVEMADKEV
jgi:hypothetical protein